ncbi:hypothetical protein Vadar_025217 [Vaccinium darrowii]|uniref:Uncharacterized protein n=1 Tax=Vaccinium darrowii TaxID=229202 RepID=A0ACB7Z6U3_9ERIC|nr:hypothetical protein Vadar_025217 [Vaccinium darrowii]
MGELRCTLKVHVGGQIVRGTQVEYVKGVVATCKVDPDSFTYYGFMEVIDQTGYYEHKHNLSLFYTRPMWDMNTGLVPLTSHDDMLHMFAEYFGNKFMLIHVYVHSPYVDDSDEDEIGTNRSAIDQGCLTELGPDVEVGEGEGVGDEGGHFGGDEAELGGQEDGDVVGDELQVEPMDEDTESDCEWTPYSDESSSCASFSGVEESSDEEQEETIALVGLANYNLGSIGDVDVDPSSDSDENNLVEGCHDDGKPDFPEFKESFMKNPQLIEGMKFPNVRVFRKLLRKYHIKEGYMFKFVKNESKRVTVVCAKKCGFRLHASPMYEERSFQIKKINQQHECTREYTNNNATSSWLFEKYLTKLSDAPETKVKSMKKIVRRERLINVSKHKVYRAKRKALELIEGDHSQQYLRLWDYCEMVRMQNPSSVAKLKVERPWVGHGPIFQRMFICYDACVKGFLAGCKPLIGLDACFLKGPFGGQLMHAVAKDANNQMFPLAFAIVEAETKDSWTWFMENLASVIGNPEERGITFMSDRQKGLTQTFGTVFPNVEYGYCIRHMYSNFNKTYKGKEWKDLMWGAASVYTIQEFEVKMKEIAHVDTTAYEWLMREEPKYWARCMYEFDPISPPPLRTKSGRPKKNRRKDHDEPKNPSGGVRKHYTTIKCRLCKQPGHNARTCSRKSTQTTGEQMEVVAGGDFEVAANSNAEQCLGGGSSIGRGAGRGRGRGGGRGGGGGRGRGANTGPSVVEERGRGPTGATVVEGRGRATSSNIGVRGRATIANIGVKSRGSSAIIGRRGRGSSALPNIDHVGKGKQPLRMPTIGLPRPQGWNFSTRLGNAMFMTQPARSSAASCGSGSGTSSATMPGTTSVLRQYSQGATSTPNTQKSTA